MSKSVLWLVLSLLVSGFSVGVGRSEPIGVNNIADVFTRLRTCWKPPPTADHPAMDITVVFSFNRQGEILGHPRITYDSGETSDNDRIAVMEALQRCTPMPFTESMAGAVAGRPFAVLFNGRNKSPSI